MIHHKLLFCDADDLFNQGDFEGARQLHVEAIAALTDNAFTIPIPAKDGGVRSEDYIRLGESVLCLSLLESYNAIAICCVKLNQREMALDWLEEVKVLVRNISLSLDEPIFGNLSSDWKGHHLDNRSYYSHLLTAAHTGAVIFYELGNTANVVHRRWTTQGTMTNLPDKYDQTGINDFTHYRKLDEFLKLRHPEPRLVTRLEVIDDTLQVRGSWQKIDTRKAGGIPGRHGFASFVWKGRLYVAGGEKSPQHDAYRDFWYINLRDPESGWHALPPYPVPEQQTDKFLGFSMAVHEDRAYLFTGRPVLDYFDLVAETWGQTRLFYKRDQEGSWPYKTMYLSDCAMVIVKGKIYVFGG
ncbi:hypothetical protein JAAARDRAFT_137729 [Jaapia argillacea MUCL 33604]|uniref:Uncharacterized protein n=1 Tax=Jaapia argillacea MUCL 33604 TaxID=933084 RepID=A0A067PDJ5_9AGAM|nr:hypothetical protein JAAARDRAFT_137729 [Jaapia argillacea MUCL 33604]